MLVLLLLPAATGYNVYYNGVDPIPVPRHTQATGWASEFLESFEPSPHVRLNATHATIDMSSPLIASFAGRNWGHHGEVYAGFVRLHMGPTPLSLFAGTSFMKAEKSHILHHEGPWPTASGEHAAAESKSQDAATRLAARAMRPLRNQRMNALASERGWATGMIGGGLDSNLLAEARAWAASTDAGKMEALRQRSSIDDLRARASAAWRARNTTRPRRSDNNCAHFELAPGMQLDDYRLVLPLGTHTLAYRAHMNFQPNRFLAVFSGTATWSVNPETGKLECYYALAGHLYFPAPPPGGGSAYPPAAFYVGAHHGGSLPASLEDDGRDPTQSTPSDQVRDLTRSAFALPRDYEMLYQDNTAECAAVTSGLGTAAAVALPAARALVGHFAGASSGTSDNQSAANSQWSRETQSLLTNGFATTTLPCSNVYLRADTAPNTYDELEALVEFHALLEMNKATVRDYWTMITRTDWDDGALLVDQRDAQERTCVEHSGTMQWLLPTVCIFDALPELAMLQGILVRDKRTEPTADRLLRDAATVDPSLIAFSSGSAFRRADDCRRCSENFEALATALLDTGFFGTLVVRAEYGSPMAVDELVSFAGVPSERLRFYETSNLRVAEASSSSRSVSLKLVFGVHSMVVDGFYELQMELHDDGAASCSYAKAGRLNSNAHTVLSSLITLDWLKANNDAQMEPKCNTLLEALASGTPLPVALANSAIGDTSGGACRGGGAGGKAGGAGGKGSGGPGGTTVGECSGSCGSHSSPRGVPPGAPLGPHA